MHPERRPNCKTDTITAKRYGIDRELVLTDWEACDLLDPFHAVTQDEYKEHESKARGFLRTSDGDGLRRLLIEDFQRTKKSGPSRIHMANEGGEPFGLDIVEGDPTFTFKASYVHEGTASGVRITSNQSISDVINGRNGFYIFSRERPDDSTETDRIGIDGLFRCTDKLRPALQVLPGPVFRRSGRRVHRRKRLAHVRPNHRAETHRSGHRIRHSAGSDRSGGNRMPDRILSGP